jgi:hypothetical protein
MLVMPLLAMRSRREVVKVPRPLIARRFKHGREKAEKKCIHLWVTSGRNLLAYDDREQSMGHR